MSLRLEITREGLIESITRKQLKKKVKKLKENDFKWLMDKIQGALWTEFMNYIDDYIE